MHGKVPEEKATKHVDTGALGEDFLHNMMHDGEGDHEEADKELLKERPVEIGDVSKMNFDKESLKQFKEDAFKDPDPNDKKVDSQDHGPERPDQALHGVLMHGDEVAGKDHSHEDQLKEEDKPRGEDTVRIGRVSAVEWGSQGISWRYTIHILVFILTAKRNANYRNMW